MKESRSKEEKHLRKCGGSIWNDPTLSEWDPADYRFFIGDLGKWIIKCKYIFYLGSDVTEKMLRDAFEKYKSLKKVKIVTDKTTKKSKGYGFVSVGTMQDALSCLNEMHRAYIGNRPITVKRSKWKDREINSKSNKRHSIKEHKSNNATRKFKKKSS